MKTVSMLIDEIAIGERHRRDHGDIDGLAASMSDVGQLQPVGVTSERSLIFGERRIMAALQLGWTKISAVVLDSLPDAAACLRAERDENECRKEFTPSELVSVGRELEAVFGPENRQMSRRNLLRGNTRPEREHVPSRDGKTSDQVGSVLGVSGKHFEQAKKVVDSGTSEVVAAMDAGTLSVRDAAAIADLHPVIQRRVASAPNPRAAAKKALAKGKPPKDDPIPDDELSPADEPAAEPEESDPREAFIGELNRLCTALDRLKAEADDLAHTSWGRHIHRESVTHQIEAARSALWQSRPTEECNCVAGGKPANAKCGACYGTGWTIKCLILKHNRAKK